MHSRFFFREFIQQGARFSREKKIKLAKYALPNELAHIIFQNSLPNELAKEKIESSFSGAQDFAEE